MRGGSFHRDHALEEARALLALEPSPTAIFAANHVLAEACMVAFKAAEIRVPRDMSLAAFDDVEWMQILDRTITAVRQPVAEMAQAAAEMLLRRVRGFDGRAAKVIYQPDLVLRDSIGPPHAES
jgi:LacI family transcriptional regulator